MRGARVGLTILATSDLHAAMLAYDYFADRPGRRGSLARLATMIAAARKEAGACLLLDNGDFLLGTPLADAHLPAGAGRKNPVIAAMTALGYDAAALGNHEFDLEREDLRTILGEADFPLLCANLRPLPGGGYEGLWQDGVVIPVRARDTAGRAAEVKVGVFGVLPPQVMQWDGRRVTGRLEAEDIASAATRAAQGLRAAGADLVVALAHSGISAAPHVAGAENAAAAVARLDTVDAVVAGHVHKVFPGPWGPEAPGIDSDRGRVARHADGNAGHVRVASWPAGPDAGTQGGALGGGRVCQPGRAVTRCARRSRPAAASGGGAPAHAGHDPDRSGASGRAGAQLFRDGSR